MGSCTQSRDRDCVPIQIAVVGEHGDQHRHILVSRPHIVARHRIVIDRQDVDGHRRRTAVLVVGDGVGKAVAAEEVGRRRVADRAALDQRLAVRRHRHREQPQRIALDIAVVGEHVDHHRAVLIGADRRGVLVRRRHVILRVDLDGHRGRAGLLAVAERVGEAVGSEEIGVRRVADAAAVDRRHAVFWNRDRADGQRVAVRIAVVGAHVDQHETVFGQLGHIVHRLRRVIDRGDADLGAAVACQQAVGDAEGEAVAAEVERVRHVKEMSVEVERQRAMSWCVHEGEAERIAIDIAGDELPVQTGVFLNEEGLQLNTWRAVDARDINAHLGLCFAPRRIGHHVGEAIMAVVVGRAGL